MVPGAAPALAKAGVGGFSIHFGVPNLRSSNYKWYIICVYIYIYTHFIQERGWESNFGPRNVVQVYGVLWIIYNILASMSKDGMMILKFKTIRDPSRNPGWEMCVFFGSNLGHVWPLPKFWASRLRWYNFGHTPEIALLWAQERQNWDCRGAATLQGFDLLKDNLKFYQFVIVLSCYIVHKGCSIYWQWSLAETQRK